MEPSRHAGDQGTGLAATSPGSNADASVPISESDPRVFFAAERTLLAWLRTGLTIIALGFVVSRFGLFVRLLAMQLPARANVATGSVPISAALGIAFVIAGALAIFVAALQHRRFIASLPQADLPRGYSQSFALILSHAIAALGVALAAYLLMAQP